MKRFPGHSNPPKMPNYLSDFKSISALLRGRIKYTLKVVDELKDVNNDKSNNVHMRVLANEIMRILINIADQDRQIIKKIESEIVPGKN